MLTEDTGPPQLFVMVVNIVINSIVGSRLGYKDDDFYVPVFFYANDGLLLARSYEEAEEMIQMVVEVAGECGLKINKGKRVMYYYSIVRELSQMR